MAKPANDALFRLVLPDCSNKTGVSLFVTRLFAYKKRQNQRSLHIKHQFIAFGARYAGVHDISSFFFTGGQDVITMIDFT